jgi:Leucine-rich repeat (LRR) protein
MLLGITMTATTMDGVERAINLPSVDEIDISQRGLTGINLASLKKSAKLKNLNLYGNHLQDIDLSPLSSCPNLESLSLGENKLQKIDLGPLGPCKKLEILSFSHNEIQEVDLTPLHSSSKLRYLGLGGNVLRQIDLSPLETCQELRELYLYDNRIEKISLSPLSKCKKIEGLYLYDNNLQEIDFDIMRCFLLIQSLEIGGNQIKNIGLDCIQGSKISKLMLNKNLIEELDLKPLAFCRNLSQLDLSNNHIKEIDLSPLIHCADLHKLSISGNDFSVVDLTPLVKHTALDSSSFDVNFWVSSRNLKRIDILFSKDAFWGFEYGVDNVHYDVPVAFRSIDVISHIFQTVVDKEPEWKLYHLMHSCLALRGFSWCGMLDIDPKSTLRRIIADQDSRKISETLLSTVSKQIDREMTLGLNVDKISEYPELASRADEIIKLREAEMKRVEIGLSESTLDLRPLLLTAYGNQILTALAIGTSSDEKNYDKIESAMDEIGYKLRVNRQVIGTNRGSYSEPLAEYIWELADYNAHVASSKDS